MKVEQVLSRWSNGRILWLLFLSSGLFLYLFNGTELPFSVPTLSKYLDGISPIETTVFYSHKYLFRVLEQISQKGREIYLNLLLVDLIFTLVYTAFFSIAMVYLHNQETFITKLGNVPLIFPLVGGLFDYSENLSLLVLLKIFPKELTLLAGICSISTPLKTILFLSNSILIVLGFMQLLLGWMKQKTLT